MKSITSLGENIQAQIGAGVNKDALNNLVFSLGREGAEALRKGDYETALDRFTACAKVNEKICRPDDINYGASLHNMATALHYLGDIEQAEVYYEKAKEVFEKQPSGPFRPSQKHRIKFIEERLTLLRFGGKPSSDTYIDEYGVERQTSRRPDLQENPGELADRAESQYWKGVKHAKNRIWGLAQECFEDAISLADRSGMVSLERRMLCHNNLGVVLEEQGDLDGAVSNLSIAKRMLLKLPGGAQSDPDRVQKLRRINQRLAACEAQVADPNRRHGPPRDDVPQRDSSYDSYASEGAPGPTMPGGERYGDSDGAGGRYRDGPQIPLRDGSSGASSRGGSGVVDGGGRHYYHDDDGTRAQPAGAVLPDRGGRPLHRAGSGYADDDTPPHREGPRSGAERHGPPKPRGSRAVEDYSSRYEPRAGGARRSGVGRGAAGGDGDSSHYYYEEPHARANYRDDDDGSDGRGGDGDAGRHYYYDAPRAPPRNSLPRSATETEDEPNAFGGHYGGEGGLGDRHRDGGVDARGVAPGRRYHDYAEDDDGGAWDQRRRGGPRGPRDGYDDRHHSYGDDRDHDDFRENDREHYSGHRDGARGGGRGFRDDHDEHRANGGGGGGWHEEAERRGGGRAEALPRPDRRPAHERDRDITRRRAPASAGPDAVADLIGIDEPADAELSPKDIIDQLDPLKNPAAALPPAGAGPPAPVLSGPLADLVAPAAPSVPSAASGSEAQRAQQPVPPPQGFGAKAGFGSLGAAAPRGAGFDESFGRGAGVGGGGQGPRVVGFTDNFGSGGQGSDAFGSTPGFGAGGAASGGVAPQAVDDEDELL